MISSFCIFILSSSWNRQLVQHSIMGSVYVHWVHIATACCVTFCTYTTSLCICLLIYNMAITLLLASEGCYEDSVSYYLNYYCWCLSDRDPGGGKKRQHSPRPLPPCQLVGLESGRFVPIFYIIVSMAPVAAQWHSFPLFLYCYCLLSSVTKSSQISRK